MGKSPGRVLSSLGLSHLSHLMSAGHPAQSASGGTAAPAAVAASTEGPAADEPGSAGADASTPARQTKETDAGVGHLPSPGDMEALVGGAPLWGVVGPQTTATTLVGAMATDPRVQSAMAGMNAAAAHPLSHEESMKVLDDLGALGLLDPKSLGEAQGCLAAAGPQAERSLGTMAAFFRANVLPQLMEAKAHFAGLTPEEQAKLADEITEELRQAPEKQRQEFLAGVGAGLFPEPVVQRVHASMK